jgi:uncharacterized protein DUF1579
MRMRMLCLLLVAALSLAAAQEKAKKPAPAKPKKAAAPMQMDMKCGAGMMAGKPAMPMMAKQSAEMAKIEKLFAGNWTLVATMEPMPEAGMNQPAVSKGTQTSKRGPGGNALIDDMKSTGPTGTMVGHGVLWYDASAGGYAATWCDNMTSMGCGPNGVGNFVGDDLIFEGDVPVPAEMGGGKMHMKETYSDIKPGSFTFAIEGGPDADHMKRMITIKYKRAASAKPAAAAAATPK